MVSGRVGAIYEVDPLGLAHAFEPYAYVAANPITGIDPLGLFTVIIQPVLTTFHNSINDIPCAGEPACTQFIGSSLSCSCKCANDDGYAMEAVAYTTPRMYFLKKDKFFWKDHELAHVSDMHQSLSYYLQGLEELRFESLEECDARCEAEIEMFTQRVGQFATESMQKRN
jgi:hypothetical protein